MVLLGEVALLLVRLLVDEVEPAADLEEDVRLEAVLRAPQEPVLVALLDLKRGGGGYHGITAPFRLAPDCAQDILCSQKQSVGGQ